MDFRPPRVEDGKAVFEFHDDRAASVALAGDFNRWEPLALIKQPSGVWRAETVLPPGRYQYKFIVDGRRWVDDPSNGLKQEDSYGGSNSVLNII
jgi:1,4-alpha-glucan branching enzyme